MRGGCLSHFRLGTPAGMPATYDDPQRYRRRELNLALGGTATVVLVVLTVALASLPYRSKSPAGPLILITLLGTGNHTFNGGESYELKVTSIAPNVTASCLQVHLGEQNGAGIPLPFEANLTRAGGASYAEFNSSDSAWDGSGAGGSFCSDGGWITGASSVVEVGDSMALVLPVAHSEVWLLAGVSSPEGVAVSTFALPGEIYPVG